MMKPSLHEMEIDCSIVVRIPANDSMVHSYRLLIERIYPQQRQRPGGLAQKNQLSLRRRRIEGVHQEDR